MPCGDARGHSSAITGLTIGVIASIAVIVFDGIDKEISQSDAEKVDVVCNAAFGCGAFQMDELMISIILMPVVTVIFLSVLTAVIGVLVRTFSGNSQSKPSPSSEDSVKQRYVDPGGDIESVADLEFALDVHLNPRDEDDEP